MNDYHLTVDEEYNGVRLDVFLTKTLTDAPSRTFIKKLIDDGTVFVNDKKVKSHHKFVTGEKIFVQFDAKTLEPADILPEDVALDIFYEDKYLLVINKPVGILVHPTSSRYTNTLVNALLNYCDTLSDINTRIRPGIIHRLDQDTSGLIVVAKDNRTHGMIAKQFAQHKVRKKYLALVEGDVQFDEGVIDEPLGRSTFHHDQRGVDYTDLGKESITMYRVKKRLKKFTFLALYPKTGRTHQLRVHMAHLGHPILGDEKYGRKATFPRLALHAQSIGFLHPANKKFIEFSSKTPQEFLAKVAQK